MMLKKILIVLLMLSGFLAFSQDNRCHLSLTAVDDIYYIDTEELRCLARSTSKSHLVVYTFGIWCAPCKYNIPNAVKLAQEYDIELYVLIVDELKYPVRLTNTKEFLYQSDSSMNLLMLKDGYGKNKTRKYKNFLTEITPPEFKNIDSMSKFIVFDKSGEVILMTSYEDRPEGDDWKDNSNMIKNKIIPILETQ